MHRLPRRRDRRLASVINQGLTETYQVGALLLLGAHLKSIITNIVAGLAGR
jgi:hypothetical protein